MDLNKLKNRLNVKFEPIKGQRRSLKRIEAAQLKQKSKNEESMLEKVRSTSQVKLPSIHRSKVRYDTLQDSKSYINVTQLREKARSFREIPKVKIQSKDAINNTLTYLMKNEILTVPRIVALLQKNQSDQFIYFKVMGIYEFQACDEKQKGNNYVTVSRNGMVQNGELIPLEILVREFQIYKKIKKIDYFKNFQSARFLLKWKQIFKKKRFIQNRINVSKLLNLNDKNFLDWRIQIFNLFQIKSQGGWFQENWIHKLCDNLKQKKNYSRKRLIQINFKMLESFDLPISQSTQLLNRVLGNLGGLNISFEKKIRIQKQCEKFYKLGRQLQLSAMQSTSNFILDHLKSLVRRAKDANHLYKSIILQRLEDLDILKQQYVQDKQKILSDSAVSMDIDYTLYYNETQKCLSIRPTAQQIYSSCISQIKVFVKEMEKMGFKIIRTEQFKFVTKNVFKSGQEQNQQDQQQNTFKRFVYSIPAYNKLTQQLEESLYECQQSFKRRINLFKPFLDLYQSVLEKKNEEFQLNIDSVNFQYENTQENLQFCQKLDEGQYFILGFLNTLEFKKDLISQIKRNQQKLFKRIPIQLNTKRIKINDKLEGHLQIINNQIDNALSFIKVAEEIERVEENVLEYSSGIEEIQKIQDFYERNSKKKMKLLKDEKKKLNEVKLKMKNFIETRQNNFLKYRKSLQNSKISLTKKIEAYNVKQDSFYDPKSQAKLTYEKLTQITKNLKQFQKQLVQLNNLQNYYNLKPTIFNFLQMRIKQYETLQEIWKYTWNVKYDIENLALKLVREVKQQKYIKFYDPFRKKAEKYLKDLDLCPITQVCLRKLDSFIDNMQTIQMINEPHLRQSDIDQINYQIERTMSIKTFGSTKCRELFYEKFIELKINQLRPFISETVFKAKKQIEINQNLVQFNDWWKGIRLQFQYMEQYPMIAIFGQNLKLRDQIDQYMTMLINILNNKYGSFVRGECNQLLKKMNNLVQLLQLAEIHQQKFLNLFPILTSKYAQNQLSAEYKKFQNILNKTMKNVRVLAKPTQNLNEGTKSILNNHIKHFDSISHVLSKFLQSKRLKFQRFYFLQDYQLLQVLVGIADQKNVFRMFEGIKGWLVSEDGIKIGVIGIGDQHLVLRGWNYKNIEPELIFKNLEQAIKSNLNSIVRNVLYQYQIELKELRNLYNGIPWMCLYAIQMTLYTKQVEINCFHEGVALQAQQSLIKQAINYAIVKPSHYSNYITMLLHILHFTQQMRKQNVTSIFDFQWHSFLRFYYDKDNVVMRSLSNQIKWGGQYQGMWSLMVNTSDISRAHTCVLNNIQYANGVLLQGPSGTGKTESLKQLARCTAKYCVIFNCSQNVNLKTISKLLSGLCYTASWLCLDEINRLTVQAMSVIAKQIQTIKNAILAKKEIFNFMGKDIKLRKGVTIFSTMNPIYLKRAKLTENIKSYFRIITVAMPDHQTILQVMLYGLKFHKPRQLAQKIGSTFSNLSIQLSKGLQYDFGLRAMKFLVGNLSKQKKQTQKQNQIVSKAFYDIFYNRLTAADKVIFQKVIFDIFKFKQEARDINIQMRINIMRESPHTGIIVFGPVSAKSTLIKQYCNSHQNAEVQFFNFNSVDMRYFLGQSIHGRWEEGIVQKIARSSLSSPQKMHILYIDSVLKSQIIENFNTLLDQSKLLVLSNGSRLKIQDNFKMIMQTPHLNLISPSTITRCNLIFVADKDVDSKSLIQTQLPIGLKNNQLANRIRKIYGKLTNNQIREVGKLSKIMYCERYEKNKKEWKDNEVLGIEKAVVFAARLLGIQKKIQEFIQKQNSFSTKKNPYHYILAYQRYAEGEFLQISRSYETIIQYQSFLLKTSQQIFMKWLTIKAVSRHYQPILWKGSQSRGKSKSLLFSLKSKKYMKIPLNNEMGSTKLIKLLVPLILQKKPDEIKQKPQLIIYLENLHMCNEQTSEQIRYMMEHSKIFSIQTRGIVPIQAMAFVSESRHFKNKQSERVRRHFTELEVPEVDQIELKNIYYQFIKYFVNLTNIEATIKSSINLQSQKFCTFLAYIHQGKNSKKQQKNEIIGPYSMIKILERTRSLNFNNCKQINDFIALMFEVIKLNDNFRGGSHQDILIGAYLQFYKGKFAKQYELYLRNNNLIFTKLEDPAKKQSTKAYISTQLNALGKKLYISEYIRQQVEIVLRILENQSHYCLVGPEGSGRRTIFKLACNIQKLSYLELPSEINEKEIRKIYFQRMKKAFEGQSKQIIILDMKLKNHRNFLEFAESVSIGSAVTQLFQSEETDYMFANILDYIGTGYNKTSKSYEQVCQDYVKFSHKRIQFLIVSSLEDGGIKIFENYPTLQKKIYHRNLPQFSIQSLVQVINNILQKKLKENPDLKHSLQTEKLPKVFMKIYKIFTNLSIKNKQNNVYHFNFNQFQILKVLELFGYQYEKTLNKIKQNSDILNKSILKISEINTILAKLKEDILIMQPDMENKKSRILQIVPILEEKKKNTQTIKYMVQSQRKQIETNKQQISLIQSQIEQKLSQANPLISDALDSIQTIKRMELTEIRNNTNPHPLIKFTMQNMAILLGEPQNWQNVRKILADPNILVRIKNCSPSLQSITKVRKRIQEYPQWTFQSVSKVLFGSRFILKWIKNVVKQQQIYQLVQKKKQYIQKLKTNLRRSQQKSQEKTIQLSLKQKDSIQVQRQYSKISKQLNDIESLVDNYKRKLYNAERIKGSLQENAKKWQNKLMYFKQIKSYLSSYCILLCLQISVFPALTSDQLTFVRKQIAKVLSQQSLPLPKDLSSFTDMINIEQNPMFKLLNHEDLKDSKKVALTYHFNKYPLVIDPDNQATNWLAKLNLQKRIIYTRKNFVGAPKIVEQAMKYGEILIVLVDGQIDSFGKQIYKSLMANIQTSQYYIEYNKNTFKLNNQFKLLFFSKSKNPMISLSSALNHQVINFQITKVSLHESLINAALRIQKPALFAIKSQIQDSLQNIQRKISQIQVEIIDKLLNNKKNLIEDQQFVELLNISKSKYQALNSNKKAQQNQILQIDQFVRQFSHICNEAADIYISLKDMSKINPILIWDVEIFIQYFAMACMSSISVQSQEQQEFPQQFENINMIGGYQFEEYHMSQSRPTSALSNLSFSMSRVNSQQNSQENINNLHTSRTENNQKHDELVVQKQKKQQQIPINSNNQSLNNSNNKITKSIFQISNIFVDQSQKGYVTQERFYKILANLINKFKKSFTYKDRNIWALLLALKNDKKQDIKYLINLVADRKKRALKTVIQQNMVTEGIKTYFSKFEPDKIENQALRILSFKDNFSSITNNGLTLTDLLIIGCTVLPENFTALTQKIIKNKKLQTILDYEQLRASEWINTSDNLHPILLLMGEDPVQMISQFLQRRKFKNATLVTMGQDQGRGLDVHIQKQCRKQGIFIINNLHIAVNFIPLLIRLVQQFHFKPPHKNFRLILISSLDANLPQQMSSMCHKYIVEQPSGLKNKMKGFYQKSQSYIDHSITTQHKLTYSLCLMHSIINEMSKYGSLCWNFPPSYTTSDFLGCILAIKSICFKQNQIEDYHCNLDTEQIQKELNSSAIDYAGLRYLIGQTCYIAKMSDQIDRKKMRIIIQNHFNPSIMKPNYIFWQGSRISQHPQEVNKRIQEIDQQSPKTCGLHENTTLSRQLSDEVLNHIGKILFSNTINSSLVNSQKFVQIKPINHKLGFIAQQIDNYNLTGIYEPRYHLLKQIQQNTKIFNLKAFVNPQQLFVSAKLEVAIKNNVPYDFVTLMWSVAQKQGYYGVSNLTLQGGWLKNGVLVAGNQQKQITLFFQAVTKKKDKDPNKGKTSIPLYLSEQRGESIGNYGQNTNLLTEVYLDSKQTAQNWVVKGTAFVSS